MVAFVVDQVKVEVWPAVMVEGEAVNVTVGIIFCTVTVAVAVTVPPEAPVAVNVYVVVVVGFTVVDPDAATVPIPLSMETLVAFVVVHVNVAELPGEMVCGAAVSFAVGGFACTVTVATDVAVPLTLVAVNVYCVVDDGLTDIEPDVATVPIPLLIVTVEAKAVVQDKVAELPGVTVAGEAIKAAVGTTGAMVGSNPAPRQPDINPAQTRIVTIIKRFMAKYTLHHLQVNMTVLASKQLRKKNVIQTTYPTSEEQLGWEYPNPEFRCLYFNPGCLGFGVD